MSAHFEPVAELLRREVAAYYEARGEPIANAAAHMTLDTNSTLVEGRGQPLIDLYLRRSGRASLEGVRLLDVGCGFGALSLFFASQGAQVHAVDVNTERFEVGASVAQALGLAVTYEFAEAERLAVPADAYDLVVMNNSLCYVIDRRARLDALVHARRALLSGGWIVIRNPNRLYPIDQFTRIPFVHWLPPTAAMTVAERLVGHRSLVRLLSPTAVKHELHRAGFADAVSHPPLRRDIPLVRAFARYQHLTAFAP